MSHRESPWSRISHRALVPWLGALAAVALTISSPGPSAAATTTACGSQPAWACYSFSPTSEGQLLAAINNLRKQYGKPPLTMDSTAWGVARERSKDMYDNDYFAHDGPDPGTAADAFQALTAAGYCYSSAAENIAWNDYPDDQTTTVAYNGWYDDGQASQPHRANMLGNYTRIGIGSFKGDGRWATTNSGPFYNATTGSHADTASHPVHIFTAVFVMPCSTPTPTPAPTPTPTATPRPTATPTPTPRPTPTATPRLTPTPTTGPTPEPTPTAALPAPAAHPTSTPSPTPTAPRGAERTATADTTPAPHPTVVPGGGPATDPSAAPASTASHDAATLWALVLSFADDSIPTLQSQWFAIVVATALGILLPIVASVWAA